MAGWGPDKQLLLPPPSQAGDELLLSLPGQGTDSQLILPPPG